jgi:hypothetical protein
LRLSANVQTRKNAVLDAGAIHPNSIGRRRNDG